MASDIFGMPSFGDGFGSAPVAPPVSGAALLDIDLTTDAWPASVVVSRTGGATIYAETAPGVITAVTDEVHEDRGNDRAGWWVFGPFENTLPDPIDIGGAGWSSGGGAVKTTVAGPAGAGTGRQLDDTGGSQAYTYIGTSGGVRNRVAQLFWKNGSPTPGSPGSLLFNSAENPQASKPLGPNADWRRGSVFNPSSDPLYILSPAGRDVWAGGAADPAATGATQYALAQVTEDIHEFPVVDGSTNEQTMQLSEAALALVLTDGDLDISIQGVTWPQNQVLVPDASMPAANGFVFKAATPDGELSYRFVQSSGRFQLKVRGSDVSGALVEHAAWKHGGSFTHRVTYKPSTGEWRVRTEVQGVIGGSASILSEKIGTASGAALAAPTAFWIGSDGAGANHIPMMVRRIRTHDEAVAPAVCKILHLGDSISSLYGISAGGGGQHPIAAGMLTIAEVEAGIRIVDLSVPGATIANATVTFDASPYRGNAAIEIIYLLLGVNDLLGAGRTGAQVNADLQTLATHIRSFHPTAKIVLCMMTPIGSNAHWLTVKAAIIAAGFTDVDYHDVAGSNALNNGSDGMFPEHVWSGVHPNNVARDLVGAVNRDIAVSLGVL